MGNRVPIFITLIILGLSFTLMSNNSAAVTGKVVAKFDQENLEYSLGRNDSNTLIVSGIITCEVQDLIEGYQYIKVYLYVEDNHGWNPSVSPGIIRFHESGIERFNASLLIPLNTYNGTEIKLAVFGTWHVEPKGEQLPGNSGSVYDDSINITIIRPKPSSIDEVYEGNPGGSDPGIHLFGFPYVLLTVVLPIICAVLMSYFAVNRKRRKKGKM